MIYLDHAATTPVDKSILKRMYDIEQTIFGNPSSTHSFGRKAKSYLNKARAALASTINAKESEIIFTSGGTEANNLAIIGTALKNQHRGNHIITTAQEHHAIIDIMDYLQSLGFHVTYLRVDESGTVNINELKRALTNQTILVSVMTVNNETGIIQPIEEISHLLQDHQAYFHTDAVQAYSLLDINVQELGIDLLTASAHKLNGPKGIGFLYVNKNTPIQQIHYGGLQERQRRPGTENIIGAYGFYLASEMSLENREENKTKFSTYKQIFIEELKRQEISFLINGDLSNSVPTILNLSFPGMKSDILLTNFDLEGVAASAGSACSAGSIEPSHVLKAMYGSRSERIYNSIRFSFGSLNSEDNVSEAASRVIKVIRRLEN